MRAKSAEKIIPAISADIAILHKKRTFENKRIVVFGCSIWAVHIIKALEAFNLEINAFVDNSRQKTGTIFLNKEVHVPEKYLYNHESDTIVLLCLRARQEISQQLDSLGYCQDIHFFCVGIGGKALKRRKIKLPAYGLLAFLRKSAKTIGDYLFFKSFRRKYGKDATIFITPHGSSGEVYLSGLFFHEYLRHHNIQHYIFVVPGTLAARAANIFNISNIVILEKKRIRRLLNIYAVFGEKICNMKPLLYGATRVSRRIPSNTSFEMRHTFLDAYKYDVYNLDKESSACIPKFEVNEDGINKLFEKAGLKKGKTVIISPYVGTFKSGIPSAFWETLAFRLTEEGYCVCTNSTGPHEPAIKGTKAFFFELNHAVPVVEYAGFFIGQRSGLCDIISSAKCPVVVIYESGVRTNRLDYFSLRRMGLSDTVIEEVFSFNKQEELLNSIICDIVSQPGRNDICEYKKN